MNTASIPQPAARTSSLSMLKHLIGNTVMVEIIYLFRGKPRSVYAKCEQFNFTGSIKDRMILNMLAGAYAEGKLKAGDTIVEAARSNTGISLAAIGNRLGHKIKIVLPNGLNYERAQAIRFMGAEVIEAGFDENGIAGSIRTAAKIARDNADTVTLNQFNNIYNVGAHGQTAWEIWNQLDSVSMRPDAFVAGVGTGGTIMGIGKFLRSLSNSIRIHPVEPAECPTFSDPYNAGKYHRIHGISADFIPANVKLDELAGVIQVNDGDAILAAQQLSSRLGLSVGISSGANLLGAIKLHEQLGPDATVVTVFPDSNSRYFTTDLLKTEPVKPGYLMADIMLLDYQVIKRLDERRLQH